MIVYLITNTITGKCYVGITRKRMCDRWAAHVWDARHKTRNSFLHKSMRKHGLAAFTRVVLHHGLTEAEAKKTEILEIAARGTLCPNGYNLTPGGELPAITPPSRYWLGKKRSPESVEKMRRAKRPPISEVARRKIGDAHRGKSLSAEHRTKLKAAKSGERNPQFGKPRTEDVRRRIQKTMTGLKRPPEFGAQITERQRIKAPGAKLNRDQVREIREAKRNGEMGKTLSARYGVSQQTISLVCNGTRWGHVDG